MATLMASNTNNNPVVIDKFLGINEDVIGILGEADKMLNFRITDNLKLRKRDGYKELFESLGMNKPIRGMWYGKINSSYHFLFACDGKIYEHNLITHVNTVKGTLTDDITTFFAFSDKVYIINGHEYKVWDGTTLSTVVGYRPKIAINAPPSGGGTLYEQINALTGKKSMTFSGNNSDTVFHLAEQNIDSIDYIKVNGSPITPININLTAGTFTLNFSPANVPGNVDAGWTKGAGDRQFVEQMCYAMMYGGQNDTRIFMWGADNQIIYSDLAAGVPSAEYFPVNNYKLIGSDEYVVTDVIRQFDRILIYTNKDTWFSYYDSFTDETGIQIVDFPTAPINGVKGNVAPNQCRLINNNPFSIFEGVYEWVATNVRDERNATYKSKRVQPSLDEVDLSKAITVDYEEKGEYWLCVGSTVWVYNYRADVWYKYNNIPATCFLVVNGELYFGTNDGQIMRFDKDRRNDNGTAFKTVWEMGFNDMGANWLKKFTNKIYITLKPEARSKVLVKFKTDVSSFSEPVEVKYNLATFVNANFANWSFKTNYNPKPFPVPINARQYVYIKIVLENNSIDETATILSISIPVVTGGNV